MSLFAGKREALAREEMCYSKSMVLFFVGSQAIVGLFAKFAISNWFMQR